jgi:diguanylate cyclase
MQAEANTHEQAALSKATAGLKAAMADLSTIIGDTKSTATGFGAHLSGASRELDAIAGGEALAAVVARLRAETQNVLATAGDVEARLATTSARVTELAGELEAMRLEAHTDQLTGLGNRREFEERLDAAMREAAAGKSALTLVIFDLDHFKKFNDTKGHLIGDQVLRHVGRTTARTIRDGDTAARYGGEEFALIMPGASLEAARALAERLRVTFDLNPLVRRDTKEEIGHVTISAGVAAFKPGEPATSFIDRADRALYAAKQKGRNRVVTEHSLPLAQPA